MTNFIAIINNQDTIENNQETRNNHQIITNHQIPITKQELLPWFDYWLLIIGIYLYLACAR